MPRGVGPVGTGVVEGEGGGGGVDEQEESCGEEGGGPHGGGGGGEGAGDGEAWGIGSRVAGIGDEGEAEAAGSILWGCSAVIYIDIGCGAGDCNIRNDPTVIISELISVRLITGVHGLLQSGSDV